METKKAADDFRKGTIALATLNLLCRSPDLQECNLSGIVQINVTTRQRKNDPGEYTKGLSRIQNPQLSTCIDAKRGLDIGPSLLGPEAGQGLYRNKRTLPGDIYAPFDGDWILDETEARRRGLQRHAVAQCTNGVPGYIIAYPKSPGQYACDPRNDLMYNLRLEGGRGGKAVLRVMESARPIEVFEEGYRHYDDSYWHMRERMGFPPPMNGIVSAMALEDDPMLNSSDGISEREETSEEALSREDDLAQ